MPMRLCKRSVALLVLAMALSACADAPTPQSTPAAAPAETPPPAAETVLREAFRIADPYARREAVLRATGRLLRADALREAEDAVASSYLTDVSFSSGQLTLQDPALVRYHDDLAVVAVPEGLGIYLYDLSKPVDELPVELTRWSLGITFLDVVWGEGHAGVAYYTAPQADSPAAAHFVLATEGEAGWRVSWVSDEAPDWWLAAEGGKLAVSPDLSLLELTGPGTGTTDAFYEAAGAPRRDFALSWARAANTYQVAPPPESFESRSTWLWSAAVPSPYAALVEFIERAQRGDLNGAAQLASDPAVVEAAVSFGVTLPERRFEVVEASADRIVFRDVQGTLEAEFEMVGGDRWLIRLLAPRGSSEDPATPTP